MNPKHEAFHWLKPAIGSAIAIAAFALGVGAIAPAAVAVSSAVSDHVASARSFPAARGTGDATAVAAASPAARAARSTLAIEAYPATGGVVAKDAKPVNGATNADSLRFRITLDTADFPSGGFDRTTGKYDGDAKDDVAFKFRVSPVSPAGADTDIPVTYGAFTQARDDAGRVIADRYVISEQDDDSPQLDLKATGEGASTAFAVAASDDPATGLPVDGDDFADGITVPAAVVYDTTPPAAPTAAAFSTADGDWRKATVDGADTRLSTGSGSVTITFGAPVNGDTVKLTAVDDKGRDITIGSGRPTGDTFVWTPTATGKYHVTDITVTTTDEAGNPVSAKLSDLLPEADKAALIVVDNADEQYRGRFKYTVTGDKGNGKVDGYFTSVSKITVEPRNQNNFDKNVFLLHLKIMESSNQPLLTLTHDGVDVTGVTADIDEDTPKVTFTIPDATDGTYEYRFVLAFGTQTFHVDATAPTVDSVSYGADTANDLADATTGETFAFSGDPDKASTRDVTFHLTEAGAGLDTDGIAITGDVTPIDGGTATALKEGSDYDLDLRDQGNGAYTLVMTLKTPGTYDFSKISVKAADRLGNADAATTFDKVPADASGTALPKKLTLAGSAKDISTTLRVVRASGDADAKVNGVDWHSKTVTLEADIDGNPLAARLAATYANNANAGEAVTGTFNDAATTAVTLAQVKVTSDAKNPAKATATWTVSQPAADGLYTASVASNTDADRLFGISKGTRNVTFGVDSQEPTITAITGLAAANTSYDGKRIYAASGDQTIGITVKDYRKAPDGTVTTSTDHTSGIKTVTVAVPAGTDLDGKELQPAKTEQVALDADGNGTITLHAEGKYDLGELTVTAEDNVTNKVSKAANDAAYGLNGLDAAVVMKAGSDDVSVSAITLTDNAPEAKKNIIGEKDGHPVFIDGRQGYFRGDVSATYTVTDKWFPLAQGNAGAKAANLTEGSKGSGQDLSPLHVTDGWTKTGQYQWSVTKPVRLDGRTDKQEGVYTIAFSYQGMRDKATQGAVDGDYLTNGTFVMDWTAPTFGEFTLSSASPVFRGLLFAESETVTLNGISDDVAGVAPGSGDFGIADTDDNFVSRAPSTDPHTSGFTLDKGSLVQDDANGTLAFTLDKDSFRLWTKGTALAIGDKAGNYATTGDLTWHSAFKGLDGVVIDTVAPTMQVSYDNNDVRNGKYYKAHRTGTVTIVESNLDLLQARDGDRTVVTATVDGQTRTVPLSAFKAVSKDGRTYAATFAADRDGDWTIDASFADPLHAAATFHDEFTVDTVAPVLELSFNNNDVRNGMYYAADRIATVRETERNFSEGESVITTTATDDKGASQNAPGGSGWTRAGGDKETTQWTNTVAFTGELHYTIKATATDLAGNVAQEVSAPEFVIDKTKPSIKIERVEDKTAYAGTVAPLIDTDDTNLDAKHVKWTLVGAHRGELKDKKLPQSTTKDTDNTQTVDFADFERKADIDDVYTLTAEATDMAGNTYKTAKTFSANRFGSTYLFNAGTENLRGTYLKKSEPVTVTEINVSGLQPGKSNVVVARNASAKQLSEDEYSVKAGDDKGWSSNVYTIPAKQFAADGFYRVQLTSTDKAGNLSQNTMEKKDVDRKGDAEVNFALDTTAPTAHALNIQSGAVYYDQNGRNVGVDAKDNLDLDSAEIAVDGEVQATWKGSTLLSSTPTFRLPADGARHEITVTSVDKAGNKAVATYDNVYVASNWWQYAMNTPAVRNTLIFGLIIVLAVIAGAIVAFSRRGRTNGDPLAV
ncbi:hypothetical protein JS531_02670 [Bifidobacterium sp. CP2]|uniref:hypothetical protein n=1 Tax=Bifidobacterium sp. CP2 TaxID=2809025 RepID=UPI001BDCF57E|nr:hypothetical protein [Bifidobacterium sp. CP2]MBT1180894.1 hypothetical protein [Bifidobacterium sp. CP2]